MEMLYKKFTQRYVIPTGIALSIILHGCGTSSGSGPGSQEMPTVPFVTVDTLSAVTYKEYSAALEGKVNIDIRPQVEGYLDRIFVDEGAYVNAGQPLFKINDQPYQEQLNTALATQHAAEANLYRAELELNKFDVLTKNNVVSDIQLKTAESGYRVAKANLEQAKAAVGMATINLGYTLVKAPVSGYIGRIPKRLGSLVGRMDATALTTLSDVHEVYAYFSMSEIDFIHFNRDNAGNSMPEKLKGLPPVSLVLADGNLYGQTGRIEMVDGQFDKNTGSISLRANFPNAQGMLRSGNTGKVRVSRLHKGAVLVPQEATFELQDRTFVYAIGDSGKVKVTAITTDGKYGDQYLVKEGVKPGDRVVTGSLHLLQDGMAVKPVAATPAVADSPAEKK